MISTVAIEGREEQKHEANETGMFLYPLIEIHKTFRAEFGDGEGCYGRNLGGQMNVLHRLPRRFVLDLRDLASMLVT